MDEVTATVTVGWTSHRPIRPDEHLSSVTTTGDSDTECTLAAAQIVACRPSCEMVTSTTITDLRI